MAGKGVTSLNEAMKVLQICSNPCRRTLPNRLLPLRQTHSRSMATEAPLPNLVLNPATPSWTPPTSVPLTIFSFPSLEPLSLESWPSRHLHLPLRRDILHLAVVYEGDKTRQGSHHARNPWEMPGSHRKLFPQKGRGRARVGWKQSPTRHGGGKIHGPRPRDFSTKLNRKVYDLAWRTALSYRYRRGELVVCQDGMEMPLPDDFLTLVDAGRMGRELEDGFVRRYVREMLGGLGWGKESGRSTFITTDRRANLFTGMEVAGADGKAIEMKDVDVKDLLETGRIVIERSALAELIKEHQSDLVSRIFINGMRQTGPVAEGEVVVA